MGTFKCCNDTSGGKFPPTLKCCLISFAVVYGDLAKHQVTTYYMHMVPYMLLVEHPKRPVVHENCHLGGGVSQKCHTMPVSS